MRYGIALPNFTDVATPQAIEAAAAVAERLGWDAVWTTDHVLVDRSEDAADYRINYDAIETLAWVGARHPSVRLGTSVLVVPQRNAVILAKELATLDALSGGRVVAGVGVGWNAREFANLAAEVDTTAIATATVTSGVAVRGIATASAKHHGRASATSAGNRCATIRRRTGSASRSASASRRARRASSHGANPGEASRARTAATASATRIGSAHLGSRAQRRKRDPTANPQLP